MNHGFADLHIHTDHSDGQYSPSDTVRMASAKGLKVIAITDHDNTSGVQEASLSAVDYGVKVIPGIEISTKTATGGLHIVGLSIDVQNSGILDYARNQMQIRREWALQTVTRLRELGHHIPMEDVERYSASGMLGKNHIAKALVAIGACGDINAAFKEYLNKGSSAHISKRKIEPAEAIGLIKEAGGLAILAHPGDAKGRVPVTENEVIELIDLGIDGLEAHSQHHSAEQTRGYLEIAARHGLLVSGGSDYHGDHNGTIGSPSLSEKDFSAIRERTLADI